MSDLQSLDHPRSCPFCGSPDIALSMEPLRLVRAVYWSGLCQTCGARGPRFEDKGDSESASDALRAAAREAWDRRA